MEIKLKLNLIEILVGTGPLMHSRYGWPFAGIEIYSDKLLFRTLPFLSFALPITDIDYVENYSLLNIFNKGIKINHRNKKVGQFLVIRANLSDTDAINRVFASVKIRWKTLQQ